jgi:hypothetical protein
MERGEVNENGENVADCNSQSKVRVVFCNRRDLEALKLFWGEV